MRVLIHDLSCIIDLEKGRLLTACFGLPFEIAMPQPQIDDEWHSVSEARKTELGALGLQSMVLEGPAILRAQAVQRDHKALSLFDCFALILTEDTDDAILITGDKRLRETATGRGLTVHGALWMLDQLAVHELVASETLHRALENWRDDPDVRLPASEIRARLQKYR